MTALAEKVYCLYGNQDAIATGLNVNYIETCCPYRAVNTASVIKTSQLMLYREIIAVCSQIHTKHINTLCGQNVELLNVIEHKMCFLIFSTAFV